MGRMYPDIFPRRWPTLQDSILAMFAGAVPGAWYDPSDLSTMRSLSAADDPITVSGQVVSLILDKSQGLALGSQLIVNGTFATDLAGWTLGVDPLQVIATWSSPGVVQLVRGAGGAAGFSQTFATVAGRWYQCRVSCPAGSPVSLVAGGSSQAAIVTPGTSKTYYFQATGASSSLQFWPLNPSSTCLMGPIECRSIAGNHAYQLTFGSRPVFRVENYNLLTFTRDFANAAWSKVDAVVTANTWIPTINSPELLRSAGIAISVGQRFTISGTFRPLGNAVGVILYASAAGNGYELKVNLRTGKLISWGALGAGGIDSFAISGNPVDGYTLYASGGISGGVVAQWRVKLCDAAGLGVTGNAVDGLQIDGAQLVLGANAFRPYQWVDASGTFDQSQGRRYLESDGIDDSLRATFTDAQPIDRVSALQQVSWTGGDFIFGSVSANDAASVFQGGASPQIVLASNLSLALGAGPAIGEVAVLTERYDGVSSRGAINSGAYVSGNAGALAPGGITIGARYPPSNFGNINLYQLIMRGSVAGGMSDSQIAVCRAMCAAKGGVTL